MASDIKIPKWLREPHQNVLLAFKRQGGAGNIGDVRRAAKKNAGDAYAQALIRHGLMRGGGGFDIYRLTPEGYEMVRVIEVVRASGAWRQS